MPKIKVENVEISVIKVGGEDYISLTDMVREVENGSALIEKWLRNKNTIEFLGTSKIFVETGSPWRPCDAV